MDGAEGLRSTLRGKIVRVAGRAALLEGAADGLRRRVGLRAWPHLRRVEADLVTQVRHRLGAARFDRAFSVGSGLAQQHAIAIVRDQRGQTP